MHHIVSDGWSVEILVKEILFFYNSFKSGNNTSLQPLRIHYKDYATWENNKLAVKKVFQEYWLTILKGNIPVLKLPSDFPEIKNPSMEADILYFSLDERLTLGLKELSEENETTVFLFYLAFLIFFSIRFRTKGI